jgi:hypothetical protein
MGADSAEPGVEMGGGRRAQTYDALVTLDPQEQRLVDELLRKQGAVEDLE